jgi:hypothetical protein
MKGKISEWWQVTTQTRPTLAYVGLSVVLALAITGIILAIAIPGAKGDAMAYARQQSTQAMNNMTATRVQLQADFDVFRAALNEQVTEALDGMGSSVYQATAAVAAMSADLASLWATVAGLNQTAMSSYLSGSFGNYTIHAWSGAGGNFTGNVHLVYSPGKDIAALDDLVAGINWTAEVPAYKPAFTFNGTDWVVAELWFNVGVLQLQPGDQAIFPVSCIGLNEAWQPTLAYVDVFSLAS